jgi:isocitrate dehydrogenase (NAD+)
VTSIPGDGIGKELCASVKSVFKAANIPVDFEEIHVTGYKEDQGAYQAALESMRRNKVGIKGTIFTPLEAGTHTSFNVALRKELDLFACVVVVKSIPGYKTRHKDVNFVVIRENTEGEYSGLEHQPVPGVVESLKVITKAKSERIAKFAFDYALVNGRKKITCIHKANIMKQADGLFLRTCKSVGEKYKASGITIDDMIVDNTAMQLVGKPHQFDVMVLPNLYGTIVSNIAAGLVGSPGVLPGCNIGADHALFEPGK